MDSHPNPALAQYHIWDGLLRVYNHNLDDILANRERENVSNSQPGRVWNATRINAPRLDYNIFVHARNPGPHSPWPTVALMLGNPNPARYSSEYGTPLMEIDVHGRFKFLSSWRYPLKCLAKHTFLGHDSWQGDLITVRPLGYRRSYRDVNPWDIQTRQPYVIQPRGVATRRGKHPVLSDNLFYELVQDDRGFWRLKVSQTQSGGWADHYDIYRDRLNEAYKYTDKLYDLRRKRKFAAAGIPDPETVRPLIVQRPDALAKAFRTYVPAPGTFPERRPMEAVNG